jgi:hypothetical protein
MQSFVRSFAHFGSSTIEVKLSAVLAYAAAAAICLGWLVLLSFSLASLVTRSL